MTYLSHTRFTEILPKEVNFKIILIIAGALVNSLKTGKATSSKVGGNNYEEFFHLLSF